MQPRRLLLLFVTVAVTNAGAWAETKFILYFLDHMIDLANDPQLIRLYESAQDLVMELTNFYFYGIMPREQAHEEE